MWRVFFACGPLYFFGNSGIAERTAAGTHCQQQKLLRHCLAGYHEGFVRLPPALTRMQICDYGIALPLKTSMFTKFKQMFDFTCPADQDGPINAVF